MAKLVVYGANLAEVAGVTTTVPGAAAGFPKERLYDRRVKFQWKDTTNAGTRRIKVNQGGLGIPVGGVAFVGHNLVGATVQLFSSPDDAIYTQRGSNLVPSTTNPCSIKIGAEHTFQYWAVDITGASSAPAIAEMLLTRPLTYEREINEPGSSDAQHGLTEMQDAFSGFRWGAILGQDLWQAEYLVRDQSQAWRDAKRQLFRDTGGGARAFLIEDWDGTFRWVTMLDSDITFRYAPILVYDLAPLKLREQPVN